MSVASRTCPRAPRTPAHRGFTLVELLVVIGIIALLISVLLPALSTARRQAATVKCAAALRDIGNAFQMYGIDNKGYFPVAQKDNYATMSMPAAGSAFWWDFIGKYVTKTKLGTASSNASESSEQRKSIIWGCPAWEGYISGSIITVNRQMPGYSMNWDPMITADYPSAAHPSKSADPNYVTASAEKACDTPSVRGKFYKVSQWTKPSERLLLADGKFYNVEQLALKTGTDLPGQEGRMDITYSSPALAGQNGLDCYRHGKNPGLEGGGSTRIKPNAGKVGYNILYCDGHVATSIDRTEGYKAIRMRFPG